MYYQNYEDYMRSVLGYPMENQDTYGMNYLDDRSNCAMPYQDTKELEDCFPEIFRIINPIVCDVCDRCPRPVTRDMVDNMVEEVFRRIEVNNEIAIKINIDNRSSEKEEEKNSAVKTTSTRNMASEVGKRSTEVENRQMRRRNPFLNDLIRILILERLLGGGFFPGRPPFRPRPPMRPPFPGGPGGGRPPMPRDYDEYLKF